MLDLLPKDVPNSRIMVYTKVSSDDTKKGMNKANKCKTNAAKNAQKTQKQVTKGIVGMHNNANTRI